MSKIEHEETFHSGGGIHTTMGKLVNGEWFICDLTDMTTGIDIYKNEEAFDRMLDGWMFDEDIARHLEPSDDEAKEIMKEVFETEEAGIRDGSRSRFYLSRSPIKLLTECKKDYYRLANL